MTDFSDIQVGDEVGIKTALLLAEKRMGIYASRELGAIKNEHEDLAKYWRHCAFGVKVLIADIKEHLEDRLEQQRLTLARQLEPKLRTLTLEKLKQIEAMVGGGE